MAYERTELRIDKIRDTFVAMQKKIDELEKSIHKYRSMYGTFEQREQARERLIQDLEKKLNGTV